MDTRGLRLRASGDTKVFEVDQALVLSRQERPSLAGGGGRRSSSGGGGVSREEGRQCRPGARCPRGGRPERGRVAEG
ncbi:unnamed protein product, partial [Ectocarpus sp. 13 AM-2016]